MRRVAQCGTVAGYSAHRKRREESCEDCRVAWAAHVRARREKRRGVDAAEVPHGLNGYTNYGCRCDACSAAGSVRNAGLRPVLQEQNETSSDWADHHGQRWTGAELEAAVRTDVSLEELSRLLGRTIAAVHAARQRAKSDPKWVAAIGLPRGRNRPTV